MPAKGRAFKAFYVAFGGEAFLLDRYIQTARQTRRRVVLVDGEETTENQLVELCELMSEDPRTIIVDNAQHIKRGSELKRFVEEHDPRDQSVILVGIVRAEKLSEPWVFVAEYAKVTEAPKLKPWQKARYLDFIQEEATRCNVVIRKDAAELLFQCTGPDLYRLANEIRKLALYVGDAGQVTQKAILEITTRTPHADPFLIAEAVLAKDPRLALNLFSVLCAQSGEVLYVPVVSQLMKQVEHVTMARSMADKGMDGAEIALLLGMNVWRFNEVLAPAVQKHELRCLVRHMNVLGQLDVDLKSSSPFKRTMIEMAMLTIST